MVLLIGRTLSPVIKSLLGAVDTSHVQKLDELCTVNQILTIFTQSFGEQVSRRVYFYKSARLLKRSIVKINRGRWHSGSSDLMDQRVEIDRRILDWVVGLDTEINELVEGSDLYFPKVDLSSVVLQDGQKEELLMAVEAYDGLKRYRESNADLKQMFSYGNGLVVLLCGPSGTGKTMTVNAVAKHLNKRVLLVDFPSLHGKRQSDNDLDADLRGLFREADVSNAVLFFDECESIFKTRESHMGGDRLLNSILSEIERHEGMVFLATNRPFDLDEAMHRRISLVLDFKAPDHLQRRKIWEVLVGKGIPTKEDIDWDDVSMRYELSGGFIKNAVLSALLKAISRDGGESPCVTKEDIAHGCRMQVRGSLQMRKFDKRVVPTEGLEALVLSKSLATQLNEMVQYEKARNVVCGQWGFGGVGSAKQHKGTSCMMWGPRFVSKQPMFPCLAPLCRSAFWTCCLFRQLLFSHDDDDDVLFVCLQWGGENDSVESGWF